MNSNEEFQNAYNKYFGINTNNQEKYKKNISNTKKQINSSFTRKNNDPSAYRFHADGSIQNIDEFASMLSEIIKIATNDNIVFKPAYTRDQKIEDDALPIVTYDINSREISDGKNIKPIKTDSYIEVVNGQETGDSIQVYRQWFDCLVEFDAYGSNQLEARRVLDKVEEILTLYAGYFKKAGVSEMFFVKEIPSKRSINYIKDIAMKSVIWYVRLERIYTTKSSVLKELDLKVNDIIKKIKSE